MCNLFASAKFPHNNKLIIFCLLAVGKMSVRLNETETIVDRMVNFFVEHEDLRTKVSERVEVAASRLNTLLIRFDCPPTHRAGSCRMRPDRCSWSSAPICTSASTRDRVTCAIASHSIWRTRCLSTMRYRCCSAGCSSTRATRAAGAGTTTSSASRSHMPRIPFPCG